MKKVLLIAGTTALVLALCGPAFATYSVVSVNTRTGEVGIAGAS